MDIFLPVHAHSLRTALHKVAFPALYPPPMELLRPVDAPSVDLLSVDLNQPYNSQDY